MSNTITQTTLDGSGSSELVTRSIHIVSDGSQESFTAIFNNASFINNPAVGSIVRVRAYGSSCICSLNWSQSASVEVIAFNPGTGVDINLLDVGGLKNPNGSGATGNVSLTTTGLATGNKVTIIFTVRQR